MRAKLLPDLITKISTDEALSALAYGYRRQTGRIPARPVLALMGAQWALETWRGKSLHRFNFGNIKAPQDYEGFYCQFRCNEIIDGKVKWFDPPHPQCNFRAYQSANDGAADYVEFLATRPRYAKAWAAMQTGDPVLFVRELKLAGYFTADEAAYRRSVVSIFNEFLRKLEAEPPVAPPFVTEVDPHHSTITNEDLAPRWIDLQVDWETVNRDRDLLIAETHDTTPGMPAVHVDEHDR